MGLYVSMAILGICTALGELLHTKSGYKRSRHDVIKARVIPAGAADCTLSATQRPGESFVFLPVGIVTDGRISARR